jgi:hypothetical protein
MAQLYDMAQMTVSVGGTGNLTLGAAAVAAGVTYLTFAQAGVQDQDVLSYRVADTGGAWEVGRAPWTAAGTILGPRTMLFSSTGSLLTVSTSATVAIAALAEDFVDNPVGGISAAGTTQATATQLTGTFNIVTTAAAGTGVGLIKGRAGGHCIVRNSGANPLLIYPRNGDSAAINAQAINTAITVQVNSTAYFVAQSLTQWFSVP